MGKQKNEEKQYYTDHVLLQKALHELLEQVSKRDQKIAWINAENTAVLRALAEKEKAEKAEWDSILLRTQIQLAGRETQLNEIVTSKAWKVVLFLQKVRMLLVPLNSRRALVIQRGLDIIFLLKKSRSK